MSDFESESYSENEWEERGDLAWNEFDWERYLREQDDVLHRYLAHYEKLRDDPGRIDEVAHLMGWDDGPAAAGAETADDGAAPGPAPIELPPAASHSPF